MTAKEFLSQALTLDRRIRAKEEQIQQLHDMQYSVSNTLTLDKVQTSRNYDRLGDLSSAVMDLEDEYIRDITELFRLKYDIKKAVETLDNQTYRLILEERYINLKRWEAIAADNNYGWQWVHKIHKKALDKLAIKSDYLDMV